MQSTDDVVEGPLRYVANTVTEAMNDFEDLMVHVDPTTIDDMIEKLNSDQTSIFNKVKMIIESQQTVGSSGDAEILRLFVSGCGGTGKSYLIKTIRAWVQTTTGKDVAVAAPTGIASRNINGLTIHGMLALPVEHRSTPSYRPLSDDALKIVREKLCNVTLLIIDEVSMVSNVTLMYMHLRLQEIFQTDDAENGWFGKRNLLVLGDLLQLPPIFEGPVYIPMSSDLITKLTGSVGKINLWRNLFKYDELTINMRQKEDSKFASILSRVRLGYVTDQDVETLEKRIIPFDSDSITGKMLEVVERMENCPVILSACYPPDICVNNSISACLKIFQERKFN